MKKRIGSDVEILYFMDDLKASVTNIDIAQTVNRIVKMYAQSVGIVITKKSAIQLNTKTPLPESLQDIPNWMGGRTSTSDSR